ncbi:MAG: glycoside hydrolase family 3 protein, partial [Lachnospiraceae bacterium]
DLLQAPPQKREAPEGIPVVTLDAALCVTKDETGEKAPEPAAQPKAVTLPDVKAGKATLSEFTASLDEQVLYRLVAGAGSETKYQVSPRGGLHVKKVKAPSSSGATTALFTKSLGIPAWFVTDGPAGAHIPFCGATCWPVGMVLAQTWDLAALEQMGQALGKELAYYHQSVLLGPGMNIHRDPLCGRNFEYFSEDPVLSGRAAAAITRGLQKNPGVAACIKHFCCNNQEADRANENNTVSVRALRELYLRGFEICVREGHPRTLMTSYNKVNGCHTSSSKTLLTSILRDEWGFDGCVMTDWGTTSDKVEDLKAGNNLIMGGYRSTFLQAAFEGWDPVFADDGYVKIDRFRVYGGFMTEEVENWNTFTPEKGGPDTVSTKVAPGKKLAKKAEEYIQRGIASVKEEADGSRTVTYTGKKRGKTLSRAVLEENARCVLAQILDSVSFDVMMGN